MGGRSNGNLYLQGRFFKARFGGVVVSQPPPALVGITAGFNGVTISGGGTTTATFTVGKSDDLLLTNVTVAWAIAGTGLHPLTGAGFPGGVLPSGTISLPAGTITATITVTFAAGSAPASPLTGHLALGSPTGGAAVDPAASGFDLQINSGALTGTVSITGSFSTVTVNQASQTTATFTVSKTSNIQSSSVTVPWAVTGTGGSPAKASDFVGGTLPTGNLVIDVGVLSATVTLTFAAEAPPAAAETGLVTLSTPSVGPATLGTPTSFGFTIASQVIQPPGTHVGVASSFSNVTVDPANQIIGNVSVAKTGATNVSCTVDYAVTADPNATLPVRAADFGGALPSGTLSIGAAIVSKQISLTFAAEAAPASDRGGIFTLSNPQPAASVDLDAANVSFPFIINKAVVQGASQQSGLHWFSGMNPTDNTSPGNANQLDQWGTWRGRLCDIVNLKFDSKNQGTALSSLQGKATVYANAYSRGIAVEQVFDPYTDELPTTTAGFQAFANGNFDTNIIACLTVLNGYKRRPGFVIRLFHEADSSTNGSVSNDPTTDKHLWWNAFAHAATLIRNFSWTLANGPAPLIDLNFIRDAIADGTKVGGLGLNALIQDFTKIDILSVDYYCNFSHAAVPNASTWDAISAATAGSADKPKGLKSWFAYARSKGKKTAIPEWGVATGFGAGTAALGTYDRDYPWFIDGVWRDLQSNADIVQYDSYFEGVDGVKDHDLDTGSGTINHPSPIRNPLSSAKYKALWTP